MDDATTKESADIIETLIGRLRNASPPALSSDDQKLVEWAEAHVAKLRGSSLALTATGVSAGTAPTSVTGGTKGA